MVIFVVLLDNLNLPGFAQDSVAENTLSQSFRIGFLRNDIENNMGSVLFNKLRLALIENPKIQDTMKEAGIKDVVLQSFDSHILLVEAMDGQQLDIVFCSALDFGLQKGEYEPVFQMRKPGDFHSSTGNRVWYNGAIFVSNSSPLFKMDTPSALQVLPEYLKKTEIAMVGSNSAAGYLYPLLTISDLTSETEVIAKQRIAFWNSSSETVKSVVNGIHEIGACEINSINEVLMGAGIPINSHKNFVKVLIKTDPIPRDPVALHKRWLPNEAEFLDENSPEVQLGRSVLREIQIFFDKDKIGIKMETSSREPFNEVYENLQRFNQIRKTSDKNPI